MPTVERRTRGSSTARGAADGQAEADDRARPDAGAAYKFERVRERSVCGARLPPGGIGPQWQQLGRAGRSPAPCLEPARRSPLPQVPGLPAHSPSHRKSLCEKCEGGRPQVQNRTARKSNVAREDTLAGQHSGSRSAAGAASVLLRGNFCPAPTRGIHHEPGGGAASRRHPRAPYGSERR